MHHMNNVPQAQPANMQFNYPEHLNKYQTDLYNACCQCYKKKVKLVTVDQKEYIGTIEHIDNMNVYVIVENGAREEATDSRHFGYPGYGFGYPGYGFGYPGYGFGYPGYGPGYPGYNPAGLIFPLIGLTALSLL